MSRRINLNGQWRFAPWFSDKLCIDGYDDSTLVPVRLPHAAGTGDPARSGEGERMCGYRRYLDVPAEWEGKSLLLTFEGVANCCTVYINSQPAAEHCCPFTAFAAEISPLIRPGERNLITVRVDGREDPAVPPFGGAVDEASFYGIYREVWLEVREKCRISDVYVMTPEVSDGQNTLCTTITVEGRRERLTAEQVLMSGGLPIYRKRVPVQEGVNRGRYQIPAGRPWSCECPSLYTLCTNLFAGEELIDSVDTRFGFRTCRFAADGFRLNGEKVKLAGLSRRQSYPCVGWAMPAGPQRRDAEILKNELGLNTVRLPFAPPSRRFLDRCDELGLLVLAELPLGNAGGGERWREQALKNFREMILQCRNHPCISLWAIPAGDAAEDAGFSAQLLAAAAELDPGRQTGGVHTLPREDGPGEVYLYEVLRSAGNGKAIPDRRAAVGERGTPYIAARCAGTELPAGAGDGPARLLEHALRHARALSAAGETGNLCGAIFSPMADYATGAEYAAWGGMCREGVLDEFRNPKPAAAVYESQREETPFLALSSDLTPGREPVYAFTNAEEVLIYRNGRFFKSYVPGDKGLKGLAHPPVALDDPIGNRLEKEEGFDHRTAEEVKKLLLAAAQSGLGALPPAELARMLRLTARKELSGERLTRLCRKYLEPLGAPTALWRLDALQGGKTVCSVTLGQEGGTLIRAKPDRTELEESDTYDVSCIAILAEDPEGNLRREFSGPVLLRAEGAVELLGPAAVSLRGGMAGTYVRTVGTQGSGRLFLRMEGAPETEVYFTVSLRDAGGEKV